MQDQISQLKRARNESEKLLKRHKSSFDDATECLQAAKELSTAANELLRQLDPDFAKKTQQQQQQRVYYSHPSEMTMLHELAKEQYELTRKRFERNCGRSFPGSK